MFMKVVRSLDYGFSTESVRTSSKRMNIKNTVKS